MQADVQTSEFLQEDETNAEKNVNNNQKIIKNKKKKRRKRGRPVEERSWSHYIYQVLKRDVPPPSNGITKKAMDVLDNMTKHLIELILNETSRIRYARARNTTTNLFYFIIIKQIRCVKSKKKNVRLLLDMYRLVFDYCLKGI